MTKKQRAKIESHDQKEQFVERVARAEKMIVATLLFPEICGIDEEDLPIFEGVRDAVHEAAHELADAIIVAEQRAAKGLTPKKVAKIRAVFEAMTEKEHRAMKAIILELAEAGHPGPEPNTIEGFCLAAYTDDGRINVSEIILEGSAPATATRRAR